MSGYIDATGFPTEQSGLFDPPAPTTATVTLYANCGHPDTVELSPGQSLTIRGEPAVCTACNAAAGLRLESQR